MILRTLLASLRGHVGFVLQGQIRSYADLFWALFLMKEDLHAYSIYHGSTFILLFTPGLCSRKQRVGKQFQLQI